MMMHSKITITRAINHLSSKNLHRCAAHRALTLGGAVSGDPTKTWNKQTTIEYMLELEDELRAKPQDDMDTFTLLLSYAAYNFGDGYPYYFWTYFDAILAVEIEKVATQVSNSAGKVLDKMLSMTPITEQHS